MKQQRGMEFWVGVLMLLAVLALVFLALRVSGLANDVTLFSSNSYSIHAEFNNIGSLKVRSPVRIAGVEVGTVTNISLDPKNYWAKVTMRISGKVRDVPEDSLAKVAASGLLGDNFVSIMPGASMKSLHNGSDITHTYGATDITSLLSTFANSFGGDKKTADSSSSGTQQKKSPFKSITP